MSSGSKKTTIGYRYSLGEHLALVHGPVDKCTRLRWDERVAWEGSSTGGRIDVAAENLFGGDKREGGVSGAIDFETGAPAQGRNSYLQAKLGTEIPAFRGVASLVFRQLYLGNNPYLKPMDVRLQRIHVRQDGVEQWYDAKSEIPTSCGYTVQTTGWLVTRNTLGATTISPDGVDWSAFEISLGNIAASWFRFPDNSGLIYSVGYNSQSFGVSTDNGETFTGGAIGLSVSAGGGRIVWDGSFYYVCGGVHTIKRSPDLTTWTQPTASTASRANAVHAAGGYVYVASIYNAGINRSSDFGATWEWSGLFIDPVVGTGGLVGPSILWRGNAEPQKDSTYTLMCTQASGLGDYIRRIYKINSSVTTQTLVLEVPDYVGVFQPEWAPDGLAYDGNGGWVAALLTDIWYSRNDGATWTKSVNSFVGIFSVSHSEGVFMLTHSTGVARSTNGGETWTSYTPAEGAKQYFGILSKASTSFVQNGDMNPAHIIRECLTDPDWGMGYPEDAIDDTSFTAAADQLFSEQMGISILWDRESTIQDFVDLIVQHIDAAFYVSRTTGKFVLKLIRSDYNVSAILELGEGEIERVDNYSRPAFGELINEITVNYWDCKMSKTATVTAHNDALIQLQGGVIGTTINYPGFTNAAIAGRVALRDLNALSRQLASCTIYANREAAQLEIGDVFKLVWPDTHDGYIVMRVTGMAFGDGRTNKIRIECVEDVFALPAASLTVEPETEWVNPSAPPLPADTRLVIEAPYYEVVRELGEVDAAAQLSALPEAGWITATAARPAGALNATLTVDSGAGYEDQAIVDFCPMAVLADSEGVGPTDTVWEISNPVALDELRISSWAQIDDEIVRIDAASDTSITVGRGCLDTVPTAHDPDTPIFFAQDFLGAGETTFVDSDVLNAKLLPASGAGVVSISQAATDVVTMDQRANRPYAPGNFQIDAEAYPTDFTLSATTTISWAHRNRLQQTGGVIEDTTDGNIGPEAGTTYTVQLLDPDDADALIAEQTGVSGTSAVFDTSAYTQTAVKFVLWSVRGGVASWQKHEWIANVASASSSE